MGPAPSFKLTEPLPSGPTSPGKQSRNTEQHHKAEAHMLTPPAAASQLQRMAGPGASWHARTQSHTLTPWSPLDQGSAFRLCMPSRYKQGMRQSCMVPPPCMTYQTSKHTCKQPAQSSAASWRNSALMKPPYVQHDCCTYSSSPPSRSGHNQPCWPTPSSCQDRC